VSTETSRVRLKDWREKAKLLWTRSQNKELLQSWKFQDFRNGIGCTVMKYYVCFYINKKPPVVTCFVTTNSFMSVKYINKYMHLKLWSLFLMTRYRLTPLLKSKRRFYKTERQKK
jgi:hypothetical protein